MSYYVNSSNGYGLQPDPITGQLPAPFGTPAVPGSPQYVDLTGKSYQTASTGAVTPQNMTGQMDQAAQSSSTALDVASVLASELAGAVPYDALLDDSDNKKIPASGSAASAPSTSGAPSKDEGKSEESRGKGLESQAQQNMPGTQDMGDSPGKAAKEGVQGVKQELAGASKELMGTPEGNQLQQLTQSLSQQGQQISQVEKVSKQSKMLDKNSQMQDKASGMLDKIGMMLEKTGETLSNAGQGMIASGQSMLSNPFTAAAGAALVAAGTALKIAGLALKAAGKAMQMAAKALAKIAKVLSKIAQTLMKVVNKILDKLNKVLGNISKRLKDILAKVRGKLKLKSGQSVSSMSTSPLRDGSSKLGGAPAAAKSQTLSKVDAKPEVKAPAQKVDAADAAGKNKNSLLDADEGSGGWKEMAKETIQETATDFAISTAIDTGTQAIASKLSGGAAPPAVEQAVNSAASALPFPAIGLPGLSANGFASYGQPSNFPVVGNGLPPYANGFAARPFQPNQQVG